MPRDEERIVEVAGRAGLASQGAIWIVTGLLALRLAFEGHSKPGAQPDKSGALHTLAAGPFGHVLLLVLVIGFAAMVVWSVFELTRKRDGERSGHWAHRAVAAGRGLIYGSLALSTIKLLLGSGGANSGRQEQTTARVLGWPGGRLLVGAVALALLGAAAYNIFRAISRRYEKHWDRARMDAQARRIAGPVEATGNVGHALVFGLVGWFLMLAAVRFDASQPKSLEQSLSTLVQQPHGRLLCLLVAAGMVAWALTAFVQSRWREIPARD